MFALALLAVAAPPLRVGAVFNVTGSFASTDGPGLHGLELAAARHKGRVEVVVIDTRSKVKDAAGIVRKAIQAHRLDALIGLYDSDYALEVGREAQRAKIPFVTSGATLPGLTKRIGSYAFAACYGDDDQARAMAAFALRHFGGNGKFAATSAFDPRHVYTRTVGKDFAHSANQDGGLVKAFSAATPEALRRTIGLRLVKKAVYAAYLPEDAVNAVRVIRSATKIPILSGDGFDTPDLWSTAGLDTSKVFFTTHVGYDAPDKPVQEFVRLYRQRYGKSPESAAAALAFDSLNLVAAAQQRRGRKDLRSAIAGTRNFPGVTGTITYRPGVREPEKPISVMEIVNGRPKRRALISAE
jgi:branched-chain amino acid transport system substrate-binding protein